MAVKQRLTPTLFDKLSADVDLSGLRDVEEAPMITREGFRHYMIPKLDRFNEAALRATIRRELAWLLNTTNYGTTTELEPYPRVQSSVLNYGVPDLAGRTLGRRTILQRAREIRNAIRAFEPRISPETLVVEPVENSDRPNMVTFLIQGDISAAAKSISVQFRTHLDPDSADVDVRD